MDTVSKKFLGVGLVNALGISFLTMAVLIFTKTVFTVKEVEGVSQLARMA